LLLHPRTRPLALVAVLFFHVSVGLLFPIGVFPWLMVLGVSLFCAPDWPRRWLGGAPSLGPARPLSRPALALGLSVAALIALFPGRAYLEPGSPSWHERGHRFAWRVLLNEKTGLVDFRVVEPATGRRWAEHPAAQLTPMQHEQLRTQPDLIRDFALHLAAQHRAQGREVAVYADAWAALNGRPAQRLLRPELDLTRPLPELEAEHWIVPLKP
ncbi:MAG: HTTM domain-containing protein, partial [Alphaproteobacteria bacterium]|nr:HTTM domain-containing protein [Alphaproteobacteria bacterium]